jgi:hypothetical protein
MYHLIKMIPEPKHHTTKAGKGIKIRSHVFLTSLDEG